MSYFHTDHPIAICQGGLVPRSTIGRIDVMFGGVRKKLEEHGCKNIIFPEVAMTGTTLKRAVDLNKYLEAWFDKHPNCERKIHLIGHSMGGLDSRALVHLPNLTYKVLSITTLSSPHHGSCVADFLSRADSASGMHVRKMTEALVPDNGFFGLSGDSITTFNRNHPDIEGTKYYSIGASITPHFYHPMFAAYKIIKNWPTQSLGCYGPNDGIVSVVSAQWGEYLGTMHGVNHLRLMGWDSIGNTAILAGESKFSATTMFAEIMDLLARKVEGKLPRENPNRRYIQEY